jgi:hypothetical protein
VIDIEAENSTPSPTVNPGVRLILIGHSMGYVDLHCIQRRSLIPPS